MRRSQSADEQSDQVKESASNLRIVGSTVIGIGVAAFILGVVAAMYFVAQTEYGTSISIAVYSFVWLVATTAAGMLIRSVSTVILLLLEIAEEVHS